MTNVIKQSHNNQNYTSRCDYNLIKFYFISTTPNHNTCCLKELYIAGQRWYCKFHTRIFFSHSLFMKFSMQYGSCWCWQRQQAETCWLSKKTILYSTSVAEAFKLFIRASKANSACLVKSKSRHEIQQQWMIAISVAYKVYHTAYF